MTDIVGIVTDNLPLLAGLLTLAVVVGILAGAMARMHQNRYRVRLAELAIEQSKLKMVQRQELLKEYSNAAIVLDDAEKERLDAINEDLATLSRRAIALMSEVDARTTRLERGVEIARMSGQLEAIRQNEAKLFTAQG